MSVIGDTLSGVRRVLLLDDKVERMQADLASAERTIVDHEKRLTRIETIIEIAGQRRISGN